jgi:hypothetical protein
MEKVIASKLPDSRPVIADLRPVDAHKVQPRKGKSRITNGTALLPDVDGRSPWVRRCKDLIAERLADLGGFDNCSGAERSIMRRASVLEVELEHLESTFALAGSAEPELLDLYARVAANHRRLLESVGLQRRSRDVTTFGDLIKQDQEEQRARLALERAERAQQTETAA